MKHLHLIIIFIIILYAILAFYVWCAKFHTITFLDEACIKPYHRYDYRTCADMRVIIDGETIIIPENFKTDLASIPRILWTIFEPQYSGFVAPAILHDYLYQCHHNHTRKFADEVLFSALKYEHVSRFTASKFYMAVRLFGWSHYNKFSGRC